MSDSGGKAGASQVAGEILRTYGIGGLVLLSGVALILVSIYKAPDLTGSTNQLIVLLGGPFVGLVLLGIGLWLIRTSHITNGPRRPPRYEIYIAAPMAGFDADEAGRQAAVDLVKRAEAAFDRLGVKNIYTPVLSRPDRDKYETPQTGFDVEWEALRSTKRYLLILPPTLPAQTSVLVTAGVAIALSVPSVVLAQEGAPVPYLVEGATGSNHARLHRYKNFHAIEHMIENDGLHLFGEEKKSP